MRYTSVGDATLLGKSSLGPALLSDRRRQQLAIPGRGAGSFAARQSLGAFGFGPAGLGPPVGVGAGAGAEIGASQGASIGSAIVPGIGTAIGALVGAIGGAIAGSLNKRDPEQANFDQAVALWQQNPDNIYAIGNKYLPLAGLMDLHLRGTPQIPIFRKYNNHGGLGEQRFVNDMTALVYQAAQSGRIGPTDTPLTIMAKVVQPWIDSWGYGPMVDPHADMINRLMVGLIMDYVLGRQTSWRARSGDYPFGNITPFSLPAPAQPQITASPTPSPAATGGNVLQQIVNAVNTPTSPVVPTAPVTPVAAPPVQTASVSTTPPAIGTPITYVRDNSTGQMIAIPPGGVFAGLTSTGGWLVQYPSGGPNPAGTYASNNGALTPYGPAGVTDYVVPSGFKPTGQTVLLGGQQYPMYSDATGNSYVWANGNMIPYSGGAAQVSTNSLSPGVTTTSVTGGGGGGYYTPQDVTPAAPTIAPAQAGGGFTLDTNTVLIAAAVGLGFLAFLGGRK